MEKYAVIMAGGAGLRLWPISRENKPKQFICIDADKSMLQQTLERINEVIPPEKCFVITNRSLLGVTRDTLDGLLPASNIIPEPSKKNTAACIAYTAMLLRKKYGPGLLCCIPADGYVSDRTGYLTAIELAFYAALDTGNLVTIGVPPSYPSPAYGYIHISRDNNAVESYCQVLRFIEKPDFKTAEVFVSCGEYLWNSGIVVGGLDVIIDNVRTYLPEHYNKLSRALLHSENADFDAYVEKAYEVLEDISFDNGVLEKNGEIQTVRGDFEWDDIGSFNALAKTLYTDDCGNSVKGRHYGLDTSGSVIYGNGLLITTIGIKDMIIACTRDAMIVCPRDRSQDIKTLVEQLRLKGYEDFV